MQKYIDIHSHFNLSPFVEDLPAAIKKMEEASVSTICVGTDFTTSKQAIEIAEMSSTIWACVGQHPTDTNEAFDIEKFQVLANNPKVVAIGECGLDYFRLQITDLRFKEIQEQQKKLFKKQIELAIAVGKPLMLHCRPSKNSMNAYTDALEILDTYSNLKSTISNLSCNFHFFVGDMSIAKQIVDHGWTMSFDGPITFSRDYDDVIKFLPLEYIMAETDSPFAAPVPHRGKTAEPGMVIEIYKKIAEIKGLDLETIRVSILENAKRVFGISID